MISGPVWRKWREARRQWKETRTAGQHGHCRVARRPMPLPDHRRIPAVRSPRKQGAGCGSGRLEAGARSWVIIPPRPGRTHRYASVRARNTCHHAPVAQLDRVLPSEGSGRGFESLRARHLFGKPSIALHRTRMRDGLRLDARMSHRPVHPAARIPAYSESGICAWLQPVGCAIDPGRISSGRPRTSNPTDIDQVARRTSTRKGLCEPPRNSDIVAVG